MDFYAIVYGYKNSDLFVNNNGFLGFFCLNQDLQDFLIYLIFRKNES